MFKKMLRYHHFNCSERIHRPKRSWVGDRDSGAKIGYISNGPDGEFALSCSGVCPVDWPHNTGTHKLCTMTDHDQGGEGPKYKLKLRVSCKAYWSTPNLLSSDILFSWCEWRIEGMSILWVVFEHVVGAQSALTFTHPLRFRKQRTPIDTHRHP